MKASYILVFAAIASLAVATGCGKTGSQSAQDSLTQIKQSDSLPAPVKKLVIAVADTDTASFAKMMSYPVLRPYPLHDIADAPDMERYYPVLVDDSLHKVIAGSTPGQWSEYGWRGWTLLEGQYLWLDEDAVYSVNYVSGREQNMIDSLGRVEIQSLDPVLRRGEWTPVACLKGTDSPMIVRIDLAKGHHKGPAYRMAQFSSEATMQGVPEKIYTGYLETEGSAQIATYHFTAPDGSKADYTPESPDGESAIDFVKPDGSEKSVSVIPAYWLDLLPKKAK